MQEQIEQHLSAAFPEAKIRVEGVGGKYLLTLIDASFEGKMRSSDSSRSTPGWAT